MARLSDILDELATVVRTAVAGLDVDVQVEPRMVIHPTTPSIDMWPSDTPRNEELSGFGETAAEMAGAKVFTVRVRIHTADSVAGQDFLIATMCEEDDLSVASALTDDQTLNGYATQVVVGGGTGYTLYPTPDGSAAWLGAEWTVTVVDAQS